MAARTRAAAWAVHVPLSVVQVALLEPRSVRTVRVATPSGWVPVSSSGRGGRPFGSG